MVSDDVVSGVWRQLGDVIVLNKVFIRSYVGNQVAAIRHESSREKIEIWFTYFDFLIVIQFVSVLLRLRLFVEKLAFCHLLHELNCICRSQIITTGISNSWRLKSSFYA